MPRGPGKKPLSEYKTGKPTSHSLKFINYKGRKIRSYHRHDLKKNYYEIVDWHKHHVFRSLTTAKKAIDAWEKQQYRRDKVKFTHARSGK